MLFRSGEDFTVFEDTGGWSWGQCGHDGYVGYVKSTDLYSNLPKPTHWVIPARALVFADNKGEYPAIMGLTMTAWVAVEKGEGDYAKLASGGWIDRKSTRLNSSHVVISYAVFCLKKKKKHLHLEQNTVHEHTRTK